MPRFAANLTMLFADVPFLDRFQRAATAGFSAVEFMFPYVYSPAEIRRLLDDHRLDLVLHNLPAGNWEGGDRGIACLPDRVGEFQEGVATGIEYATALGVPRVNCLIGKSPAAGDPSAVRETVLANLAYAAAELGRAGLELLIEPINTFDIPGFYLTTTRDAIALAEEVGAANLRIQYDVYHAQRMEGELANTIARHLEKIGHIQIADNPGRNEPGTGEINYPFLFAHLDRIGYQGHVGCEYKPAGITEAGLGWLSMATLPTSVSGAGR